MVKRSLHASTDGIQVAKDIFGLKGWTQDNLAFEVGIKTRQPIWRFFTGKPVDRQIFIEICAHLNVDWREIAENPPDDFSNKDLVKVKDDNSAIDSLVERVRSLRFDKIQYQCGVLNLLDVNHSTTLHDIYIDVNILQKIAAKQWLETTNINDIKHEDFDRFGMGEIVQSQISGMEVVQKYSRLRVLGKAGSGKTTYLQHLAIQCNEGNFAPHQVPIFITLQTFAEESRKSSEFSLLNYIRKEFSTLGISNPNLVETLFKEGRVLLLMDGLDEILNKDIGSVMKEIRRFSDIYYKNQFITTCRTAAQKIILHGFTDVEIAPFTNAQITTFVKKWFVAFTNIREGKTRAVEFLNKLEQPINWQFQRVVNTPLFLHLACWIFYEQDKFPTKRSDFYKQGLGLLLGKWDEFKGVERDEIYQGFLLPQKLKLFSEIAGSTFDESRYFFNQFELEELIGDYLSELPNASMVSQEIKYDSESVLRSIECQHGILAERARGIFSFSYLAFHEYFAARKIVASYNLLAYSKPLEGLVSHICDHHWREVFLLTASMLRSADGLMQLMKKSIDTLVQEDSYLQEFLAWASQKSLTTPLQPKVATVRAFYLALSRTPHITSQFNIANTLDQGMILDTALTNLLRVCDGNQDIHHAQECGEALDNVLITILDLGLHKSLEKLYDQFPHSGQRERFKTWWESHYSAWVEELKMAIATHRNINHPWQFSREQQVVLQNYYDANQLLLDCLSSNCEVTAAVREEIEATLLLPQTELEAHEWR